MMDISEVLKLEKERMKHYKSLDHYFDINICVCGSDLRKSKNHLKSKKHKKYIDKQKDYIIYFC